MAARASTQWTIPPSDEGTRVDAWLARRPEVGSRTRAREWIERGKVFVNSVEMTFDRAGDRLRAGDEVALWVDRPGSSRSRSRDVVTLRDALRVVFEDEYLLVADKPPGMLVEPLPNDRSEVTLRDLAADHLERTGAASIGRHGPAVAAFVVHRIDRDTSGLVVFAKDERTQVALKRQFERRTAERVYLAVLDGQPSPSEGVWSDVLVWDKTRLVQRRARPGDERGKEAEARYRVVEQFEQAALVEIRLVTGKRNQIRIQASLRHHPLVGERIYLPRNPSRVGEAEPRSREPEASFPRQALHAARLAFRHPVTGARVQLEAPLPDDLRGLIATLRRSTTRRSAADKPQGPRPKA